jgi:hypothetical protein
LVLIFAKKMRRILEFSSQAIMGMPGKKVAVTFLGFQDGGRESRGCGES